MNNAAALSELDELGKAAVRFGLAKLKPFDASITEAVDFFIKFSKPPKGKLTIQEAMDLFEKEKTKDGLSKKYLRTSKDSFFTPFREAFKNCLMSGELHIDFVLGVPWADHHADFTVGKRAFCPLGP